MAAAFSFGSPAPFRFDLGPDKGVGDLAFNSPDSDFSVLWGRVMNQLGLTNQSSKFYEWFGNQQREAENQMQIAGALNPNLQKTDFLNSYVPGLAAKFGMLAPQDRGEDPRFVGRPRFLA